MQFIKGGHTVIEINFAFNHIIRWRRQGYAQGRWLGFPGKSWKHKEHVGALEVAVLPGVTRVAENNQSLNIRISLDPCAAC
jgi:hypothetical protein